MGALEQASGLSPMDNGGYGAGVAGLNSAESSGSSGFNPLSAIVPGGVAIANWLAGQATNDANSAQAAANRQFAHDEANYARNYDEAKTKWMSTHGYQYAVEDLKAAGLNPLLAIKNGPEQGSGSGIQASAPGNAIMQNAVGQGISSGLQAASLLNDLRNTNADIAMKQAQAFNATANATYAASNARITDEETAQLMARRDKNRAEATRDAGDARWEDSNRTARMLTSKAGIGATIMNSAQSAGDFLDNLIGSGTKKITPYDEETTALEKAGTKGILVGPPRPPKFNFKTGRME